jgi:hypothetical protein
MLLIALCTVLCGGEDCTDMAEFARTKLEFLRGFLKLEHGAPSHDTFSRRRGDERWLFLVDSFRR